MRRFLFSKMAAMCAALLVLGSHGFAGATEYRAGSGPSVKSWSARNYDDTKSLGVPKLIYFYDPDIFRNNFGEKMEGKDYLGNEDVQAAMKKFSRFRVKYDGTEARGWPKEWRERSKNGAAILLMSADNLMLVWLDRQTPPDNMSAERFISAFKAVEDYDKTHKPDKEKDKDKVAVKNDKPDAPVDGALKIKGLPAAPGEDKPKEDKKPAPVTPRKNSGPADE
jgi:hypothetical protein